MSTMSAGLQVLTRRDPTTDTSGSSGGIWLWAWNNMGIAIPAFFLGPTIIGALGWGLKGALWGAGITALPVALILARDTLGKKTEPLLMPQSDDAVRGIIFAAAYGDGQKQAQARTLLTAMNASTNPKVRDQLQRVVASMSSEERAQIQHVVASMNLPPSIPQTTQPSSPSPMPAGRMILKESVQDVATTLVVTSANYSDAALVTSTVLKAGLDLAVFKPGTVDTQKLIVLGDKAVGILPVPLRNVQGSTKTAWVVLLGTVPTPVALPGFSVAGSFQGLEPSALTRLRGT